MQSPEELLEWLEALVGDTKTLLQRSAGNDAVVSRETLRRLEEARYVLERALAERRAAASQAI